MQEDHSWSSKAKGKVQSDDLMRQEEDISSAVVLVAVAVEVVLGKVIARVVAVVFMVIWVVAGVITEDSAWPWVVDLVSMVDVVEVVEVVLAVVLKFVPLSVFVV